MKKAWLLLILLGGSAPVRAEQILYGTLGMTSTPSDATINLPGSGPITEDLGRAGVGVGGQYLYIPDYSNWGIGIDLLDHGFGKSDTSNLTNPQATSDLSLNSVTCLAIARRNFSTTSNFKPYFFGGIGAAFNHFQWETTPNAGYLWSDTGTNEKRDIIDSRKTVFAGAFGLGIEGHLSDHWVMGVEGRLTLTGDATYEPTSFGRSLGFENFSGNYSILTALVRVGYRFGAGKETVKAVETTPESSVSTASPAVAPASPNTADPAITPNSMPDSVGKNPGAM